jgi:hypothetical protein
MPDLAWMPSEPTFTCVFGAPGKRAVKDGDLCHLRSP